MRGGNKEVVRMWVAQPYVNRITYRKMSDQEILMPAVHLHGATAHSSWKAAHAWLVHQRQVEVVKAKRELRNAENRLKNAMAMRQKEETQ